MAIGAITAQATLGSLGYIKINKKGSGDPTSLKKGNMATFNYNQGGGAYQLPAGDWVRVPIAGSSQNGYYANGNLASHDCPLTLSAKSKSSARATNRKGVIIIKNNPDGIAKHPSSGGGTIDVAAGQPNVGVNGDFVGFDEVSGEAKNVAVHTCTHTA